MTEPEYVARERSEEDMGVEIDLSSIRDPRAVALLQSGLPGRYWFDLERDLKALEDAGVEVTGEVVRNLAALRVERLPPTVTDRYVPKRYSPEEGDELLLEYRWQREFETCVVYYMRLGDLVKIGYTSNLENRVAAINPEEVLATEPGGRLLEAQRHKEYAGLRVHGEWFEYRAPLTGWIDGLRVQRASA